MRGGSLLLAQLMFGRLSVSPCLQLWLEVEETFSTGVTIQNESERTKVFSRASVCTAERLQTI